jgi:hypothetical protein
MERANNNSKPPRRFRRDRLAMAEVSASSQADPLAGEWPRLDEFHPAGFLPCSRPWWREKGKKLRPGSDGIGSQMPQGFVVFDPDFRGFDVATLPIFSRPSGRAVGIPPRIPDGTRVRIAGSSEASSRLTYISSTAPNGSASDIVNFCRNSPALK